MPTALTKRLLYTRPDGGVGVVALTPWCHRALTCGGGWLSHVGTTAAREAAKAEARGCDPGIEHRFATALESGGCSDAEAWGLIRDHDLPADAGAAELIEFSELPDRWFRDAWGRSHNGGPIVVRLDKARAIQRQRISDAASEEDARRKRLWLPPVPLDLGGLSIAIDRARDAAELRAIWPREVPKAP